MVIPTHGPSVLTTARGEQAWSRQAWNKYICSAYAGASVSGAGSVTPSMVMVLCRRFTCQVPSGLQSQGVPSDSLAGHLPTEPKVQQVCIASSA